MEIEKAAIYKFKVTLYGDGKGKKAEVLLESDIEACSVQDAMSQMIRYIATTFQKGDREYKIHFMPRGVGLKSEVRKWRW